MLNAIRQVDGASEVVPLSGDYLFLAQKSITTATTNDCWSLMCLRGQNWF